MCPADSGKSVLELFPCSILTPWSGKGEAGEVWPKLPKLIPLYLADRLRTEPFREETFQQNFMAEVRRGARQVASQECATTGAYSPTCSGPKLCC